MLAVTAARFLVGDVFARLADIADDSIDLVMTSPPFLALRSYLPPDHPDKHLEIGSEPTPADFIDTLLRLTAEWERVLAPHGSIAVELGDTYSGSGGAGGDYAEGGMREGQNRFDGSASRDDGNGKVFRGGKRQVDKTGSGYPDAKSACLIPELYRIGLAYGINPLTGEPSPAGRWRVRNTVRWCRPNPPVGALGDKYRPATSDLVIATKAKDRWFDLDAVRTPADRTINRASNQPYEPPGQAPRMTRGDLDGERYNANAAGAPPLDWWEISTSPYKGSHYATYPLELCRIPILSMCPAERCASCGTPRRRLTEPTEAYAEILGESWADTDDGRPKAAAGDRTAHGGRRTGAERAASGARDHQTIGWSDCECDAPDYRPGVVLDPFAGSGTTLVAAQAHGRSSVGIDLDERNAWLARERVGMFLDIDLGEHEAA